MKQLPRKSYPPMPLPAPPDDFGWVWGKWVELLRSLSAAEDKLATSTGAMEQVNLRYVVEMLKGDLSRFREQIASGFSLGLKFLAESDPKLLGRVFAEAISDASYAAAEANADALKTENRVLRGELARLSQQVAEMRELFGPMQRVLDELGYSEVSDAQSKNESGRETRRS